MARPLRIDFPGAVYHVTSRGDRREPIVLGDEDREDLLGVLGQALHRFDACALAWCLMDNHYHFVLHTRQPNLSLLTRRCTKRTMRRKSACRTLLANWGCPCRVSAGLCRVRGF